MPLESIEISGFKSIRDMSLSVRPLNVLIGANGAGKSNFVGAFGLLQQLVESRLQVAVARAGGASTLLHRGPKETRTLRFRLNFGKNAYEARLELSEGDALFFERETAFFQGPGYSRPYEVPMGGGHRETRLPEKAGSQPIAEHVLSTLRSWRVFHFHDTSPASSVKQKGKLDDNVSLRPDASNLAAFLFVTVQGWV